MAAPLRTAYRSLIVNGAVNGSDTGLEALGGYDSDVSSTTARCDDRNTHLAYYRLKSVALGGLWQNVVDRRDRRGHHG